MAFVGTSQCQNSSTIARSKIGVPYIKALAPSRSRVLAGKCYASKKYSGESFKAELRRKTAGAIAGGAIMVTLMGNTVHAQEFESAIIDGSAPLNQVEQYEELLKMAGKIPEVEVKEEKAEPKFVVKELQKKEDKPPEKIAESKQRPAEKIKPKEAPKKVAKESSEESGFPVAALAAVAVAGAGAFYFTTKDKSLTATKPPQKIDAPVATPVKSPDMPTQPKVPSKLANAEEAAAWIAAWRAKNA